MTYSYKTNINCGGCIAKVTPYLDEESRIKSWEVDTENPDKILTLEADEMTSNEVMALVKSAGFKIEEKKKGLFSRLFK